MSITIIPKNEQADGQFNGGAILEKRPVFYQQSNTFPYSNLFYWAHAWSDRGSTIGLHPHQGFEILSFVLKGSIEHYDTKNQAWLPLNAGDAQIIRSGSGISHAEKLLPGSSIFQIWFDPNLQHSVKHPATYDDYKSETFPVVNEEGYQAKIFKGIDSPLQMATEGIAIRQLNFEKGNHTIPLKKSSVYSIFVLSGKGSVGGNWMQHEDFVKIEDASSVNLQATEKSSLFLIESPVEPSYQTYIDRHG